MKTSSKCLVAASMALLTFANASASILLPISPFSTTITPASTPARYSDQNSTLTLAEVTALIETPSTLMELYKMDVGAGSDTGSAAPYYSTAFSNTPTDPANATVTWDGPGKFTTAELYVLVKDGNQSPNQFIFNISPWNRMDTLSLVGFFPQQGAISHITFYGGGGDIPPPDPQDVVPESTSVMIWTMLAAVCGVGARRRIFA